MILMAAVIAQRGLEDLAPVAVRNGAERFMGHSTTRTLERYVSNTFASHRQAVCTLQDRVRKVIEEGEEKADGSPVA